jgi:thioredoxin 2
MIVDCKKCGARVRVPGARLAETASCPKCKAHVSPLGSPVAISSAEDFDELVRTSKLPVLVDFWAAWCGPCRMVAPELEKVASEGRGRVIIAKVDTDANRELGVRFRIESIPTLARFDHGRETKRVSGAMRAQEIKKTFALE